MNSESRSPVHGRLAVLIAAFALIAAACGSGDAEPDAAGSTTSTTQTTAAPATTAPPTPTTSTVVSVPDSTPVQAGTCADRLAELPSFHVTFVAFCDDQPYPIARDGALQPSLTESLSALVAGTNDAERALGFWTGFDDRASDSVVVSASVDGAGVAHLEFTENGTTWDPGVSASAETLAIYDPLVATVFLDSSITALDTSGLCWGELACGDQLDRTVWEAQLFFNNGIISYRTGAGSQMCGIGGAAADPTSCTLNGVFAGATTRAAVTDVADDDTLNLRAGPGVEYPIAAEAAPDATLATSDIRAVASDGGVWRLVADETSAGWANEAFLALSRSASESVADLFIAFSVDPSAANFAALPLADSVALGLGPDIAVTIPSTDLADPDAWVIERDEFRAWVGPFSLLDPVGRVAAHDVIEGEHPHCAGPPVPAPDGYADHRRVAIQPASTTIDSCLQWFTFDLFIGEDERVDAITLDLWEP